MGKKEKITVQRADTVVGGSKQLYADVCGLIEGARQRTAVIANTELCMMHWRIGKRIIDDVLYRKRAEYGKQIVKNLAKKLTERYGKGWSDRKLVHCIRAAYTFSEDEIVYALRIQLTWTHLRSIMFIDDELKRAFYVEMCRLERWDTRTLDEKIDAQLYERTTLSKKPEIVIKNELERLKTTNMLTPDLVFRSSYFLDMLGLSDVYSEKDMEDSILIQIQLFIKELGTDFAFLDRQKRISVDSTDYYIDLLFYHRGLRCRIIFNFQFSIFN